MSEASLISNTKIQRSATPVWHFIEKLSFERSVPNPEDLVDLFCSLVHIFFCLLALFHLGETVQFN